LKRCKACIERVKSGRSVDRVHVSGA
jgi:hypothetical protein